MLKYLIFLYYYSLITTIALFIYSIGFAPQPSGLLLVLFLIPISVYFWLSSTQRSKKIPVPNGDATPGSGGKLSAPLIVLATLFISGFSIYTYTLLNNREAKQTPPELTKTIDALNAIMTNAQLSSSAEAQLVKEIQNIKAKLDSRTTPGLVTPSPTKIASASAASDHIGFITIKDPKRKTVDVYQKKSSASAVVGKAEFGKEYFFTKKEDAWYFTTLTDETEGWVSDQYMKIISGATP